MWVAVRLSAMSNCLLLRTLHYVSINCHFFAILKLISLTRKPRKRAYLSQERMSFSFKLIEVLVSVLKWLSRLNFTSSLNFIRLLRVVITPSVTLLRGEKDSKQSDEFQAISQAPMKKIFLSFGLSVRDVLNNLFRFEKLSILPRFYFHNALEQLKTNFHTSFRFKRVLGFVIIYRVRLNF